MDGLLKEATGKSAHMHSKQSENNMKGLLLAHRYLGCNFWLHFGADGAVPLLNLSVSRVLEVRQGLDVELAAKNFWVPMLCQRGMLIGVGTKFYICLGPTPAVAYATCLLVDPKQTPDN